MVEPIDLGFLKRVEVASLLHSDDHPDVRRVLEICVAAAQNAKSGWSSMKAASYPFCPTHHHASDASPARLDALDKFGGALTHRQPAHFFGAKEAIANGLVMDVLRHYKTPTNTTLT